MSQMVAVGSNMDIGYALKEIDSELLQLSVVCEDLEVNADLPPTRDAVFRRSQIVAAALQSEGFRPLFLNLSAREQLLACNAFMREMAIKASPSDAQLGRLQVIGVMDAKKRLSDILGISLGECETLDLLPMAPSKPIKLSRSKNVLHDRRSS
jgi:hypothetical protein